jgi:hypothetical protein
MGKISGYRCDQCKKEAEQMDFAWLTVDASSYVGRALDEAECARRSAGDKRATYHLCDVSCLVRWAIKREGQVQYYAGRAEALAADAPLSPS